MPLRKDSKMGGSLSSSATAAADMDRDDFLLEDGPAAINFGLESA